MFEYARGIDDFLILGLHDISFALIFVGAGIWSILRGTRNRTNLAYIRRQLVAWQIIVPEAINASPVLVQTTSTIARLRGWGLIGAGISMSLNMLFWMGFAYITNINPTHDQPLLGATFDTAWLISLLIGYGVGHAAGVWRLRQLAKRQPAYGDIRRRSLNDYRAPIIGWFCPALTLPLVIVTALWLPHVHATNTIPAALNPQSSSFLLDGFLLPAQMLVFTIITEGVLRWVAQLPRLLIVADPAQAQRADDIIRATTIGALQGWQFILVGLLGVSQVSLLQWHLPVTPFNLSFFLLSCGNLSLILSGLIISLFAHGRLGGTLTGWGWQAMLKRGQ